MLFVIFVTFVILADSFTQHTAGGDHMKVTKWVHSDREASNIIFIRKFTKLRRTLLGTRKSDVLPELNYCQSLLSSFLCNMVLDRSICTMESLLPSCLMDCRVILNPLFSLENFCICTLVIDRTS